MLPKFKFTEVHKPAVVHTFSHLWTVVDHGNRFSHNVPDGHKDSSL